MHGTQVLLITNNLQEFEVGINGKFCGRGRLVLLLPLRRVVGEEDDEEEELEAATSAV